MTPYSRRQLLVLLILLGVAGLGLAVGHWRRANPDLADQLEHLDRAGAPATSASELGGRGPAPTRSPDEPAPRRSRRRAPARDTGLDERAPARVATPPSALDLNRSTAIELMRVPGIGAVLARRIVDAREADGPFASVDAREADGPFASVDELRRVPGVSARRLEQVRALVTIPD